MQSHCGALGGSGVPGRRPRGGGVHALWTGSAWSRVGFFAAGCSAPRAARVARVRAGARRACRAARLRRARGACASAPPARAVRLALAARLRVGAACRTRAGRVTRRARPRGGGGTPAWRGRADVRSRAAPTCGATPAPTPATTIVAATATAFDQAAAIGSETGTICSLPAQTRAAQEGGERQERGDALDGAAAAACGPGRRCRPRRRRPGGGTAGSGRRGGRGGAVARAERRAARRRAMIDWTRSQRSPETSSSYSSVRRWRARKSVHSTPGAAEAQALADLAVGEALELAHDEDLVVGVRQAAERAAEVVELLLGVDRGVRASAHRRRGGRGRRGRGPRRRRTRPPRRGASAGTGRCRRSSRSRRSTA